MNIRDKWNKTKEWCKEHKAEITTIGITTGITLGGMLLGAKVIKSKIEPMTIKTEPTFEVKTFIPELFKNHLIINGKHEMLGCFEMFDYGGTIELNHPMYHEHPNKTMTLNDLKVLIDAILKDERFTLDSEMFIMMGINEAE